MKAHRSGDGERILAVFIDFENLALGFGGRRDRFNIEKVIERLVEKGKIVAKRAYADWSRFGTFAGSLHAAAVELVEIPKRSMTGKNSADIRLVVDAMDLATSKDHIDTFVIVSGDSDFSPLVSKLKELGKHVIGLGLADSTSDLLRDNCDEFIYYEDLDRKSAAPMGGAETAPDVKKKAFELLMDSLLALRRENKEVIYSSMVKDTMKRKKPSFNEEYHGYRAFSDLLEDAQRFGLIELDRHKPSGMYVVTRFGADPKPVAAGLVVVPPPAARASVAPPARQPEPRQPLPPAADKPAEPRRDARPPRTDAPPPRAPRAPVAPRPAAPRPVAQQPTTDVPLGRSLIDDVEFGDDDDLTLPTYMPRKDAPAKSAERPVRPPERSKSAKPAGDKPPARKPAAEKPAGRPPAKPRGEAPPRPRADSPPPRRQAPKPPAAPGEDGGFGAGLDD